MRSSQQVLHIGIYGLIEKNDNILVVRKSRGPYKGLFDLPGGRPSHGEILLEALRREIEEETGIKAQGYSFFGNFSYFVPYQDEQGRQIDLYHIALTYRVNCVDLSSFNSSIVNEDVTGSVWMNRYLLRKEDSSPLLKSILENKSSHQSKGIYDL